MKYGNRFRKFFRDRQLKPGIRNQQPAQQLARYFVPERLVPLTKEALAAVNAMNIRLAETVGL